MSEDKSLNDKAVTEDWELYVRSEINAMLDALLPACEGGNIGFQYKNLVIEETEGGPVYDDKRAVGVDVVLSFDFGREIDKPL